MKLNTVKFLSVLLSLSILTSCIDTDSDSNSNSSTLINNTDRMTVGTSAEKVEVVRLTAAGIKGPLASADAFLYSLDPSNPDLYDNKSPISSAISSQFAEIDILDVPRDIQPPFILTVGGNNAIDLNTGTQPVIPTLIAIITEDMLSDNRPIYATPLTTLAFHMVRYRASVSNSELTDTSSSWGDHGNSLNQWLIDSSSMVKREFSIDPAIDIDVLRSPLVINNETPTASRQEEAVHHRAALEAFAAKVHTLSLSLAGITGTDLLIEQIAIDLQSDGIIDNSEDGRVIGQLDPAILSGDPMNLKIPNTLYRVKDIVTLMEEERPLILADREPTFQIDRIEFGNYTNTVIDTPTLDTDYAHSAVDTVAQATSQTDTGTIAESSDYARSAVDTVDSATFQTDTGTIAESSETTSYPYPNGTGYNEPVINPANTLLLSGLITATPVSGEIIFYHDFNDVALHTYTETDVLSTWNTGTASSLQDGAVNIVPDPDPSGSHGNVMRLFYAGNSVLRQNNSGSQWRTKLGGKYEDLYLAYDVFFTDDAEFVIGGKLPGLMGGPVVHAGGTDPDGTDGWSGRLSWKENGSVANYMYVANKPVKYGWDIFWDDGQQGQVHLKRGAWNRLEVRYAMNTPGVNDGIIQAWFNGKLALDRRNILFRAAGSDDIAIDQLFFSSFYGGSASKFAPSTDQYIYFDNFVISTQPITH